MDARLGPSVGEVRKGVKLLLPQDSLIPKHELKLATTRFSSMIGIPKRQSSLSKDSPYLILPLNTFLIQTIVFLMHNQPVLIQKQSWLI